MDHKTSEARKKVMDGFNRAQFWSVLIGLLMNDTVTLFFKRKPEERHTCTFITGEYFLSSRPFSLDHFLHQLVIYLKESFQDLLLKRIFLKIMDLPEEKIIL